jgi:glucokinase
MLGCSWAIGYYNRVVMNSVFVGIEIGGTKLQLVAGAPGAILDRRKLSVDVKRGATGIREEIEKTLPDLIHRSRARAVAVGFGGPIDRSTGRISRSHQIEGWSGFDLQAWLATVASGTLRSANATLPVLVDNDANMGALGEAMVGAGRNFDSVFYITLGSGVGGGLVVGGRIYHGAQPGESEVGHLRLDRDGTIVEERCSGWAVDRKIRQRAHESDILQSLIGHAPGNEARHLARALELKDPTAESILRETAEDLAFALSHVVHLFHPAVLVLGGGLALMGEPLRAAIAAALPRFVMAVFGIGAEVRLAALGEDAVPMGCLVAASRAVDPERPAAES